MAEMCQLHKLLREKESDLERQRCVLANNEETIKVRNHLPLLYCTCLFVFFVIHAEIES